MKAQTEQVGYVHVGSQFILLNYILKRKTLKQSE